jgi:hypothetical protein
MADTPEKGIKINLISSRKLDSMSSQEKLRFILDQVKNGVVLVLERGLTALEEIDLIKSTMSEIDHETFIGIEMQSYSPDDLEAGSWFSRLLGRSRVPKMSVIGPANLLKPIRKDGNIIQAMILTGKAIAQELPEEEFIETKPDNDLGLETDTSEDAIPPVPEPAPGEESIFGSEEPEMTPPSGEELTQEPPAESVVDYSASEQPASDTIATGETESPQDSFEIPPPPVTDIAQETQDYMEPPPLAQEVVEPASQPLEPAPEPPVEERPAEPVEQYTPVGDYTEAPPASTGEVSEPNGTSTPEPGSEIPPPVEGAPPAANETELPPAEDDSEQPAGTGFLYKRLKQEEE